MPAHAQVIVTAPHRYVLARCDVTSDGKISTLTADFLEYPVRMVPLLCIDLVLEIALVVETRSLVGLYIKQELQVY